MCIFPNHNKTINIKGVFKKKIKSNITINLKGVLKSNKNISIIFETSNQFHPRSRFNTSNNLVRVIVPRESLKTAQIWRRVQTSKNPSNPTHHGTHVNYCIKLYIAIILPQASDILI